MNFDKFLDIKLLYCIVLYCIVLYCIVLYCIVLYCIVVSLYCNIRSMRSYALGAGPITYQSYDDRLKKEADTKETDTDKSLTDLRLAFEYTKVEYAMTNSQLRQAIQLALHEKKCQLNESHENVEEAFVEMNLTDRIEVVSMA